ncbi:hypothetical protein GGS23DRAFT_620126 [Durotheca rogersii]|uniref:uncharacterized protein n=1 Tax=Durotheca rogersii TaxID=419775 RepID=UPI00221EA8AB|nr:uncharacterized protein GGS23DRAFT_620126 [Durotheca rogersii]KAI5864336.1 hypothetical protein GGS23DRAFT_620126 [Durotheca rogersii]
MANPTDPVFRMDPGGSPQALTGSSQATKSKKTEDVEVRQCPSQFVQPTLAAGIGLANVHHKETLRNSDIVEIPFQAATLQDLLAGALLTAALSTLPRLHLSQEYHVAGSQRQGDHERVRQAVHNENTAKESLKSLIEREKDVRNELQLAKKEVEDMKQRIKLLYDEHKKAATQWQQQDRHRIAQVILLENEIKQLRDKNQELAAKAGVSWDDDFVAAPEFPSPSIPESFTANSIPSITSALSEEEVSKSRLDPETAAYLLERLKTTHGIKDNEIQAKPPSLAPNPKATSWTLNPAKAQDNQPVTPVRPVSNAVKADLGDQSHANVGSSKAQQVSAGLRANDQVYHQKALEYTPTGNRQNALQRTPLTTHGRESFGNIPSISQGSPQTATGVSQKSSINRKKEVWEADDIDGAIEHLYGLAKGYIVNYHSRRDDPPKIANDILPVKESNTWQYLTNLVYKDPALSSKHLKYLLGVEAYRPYIVMRMIVDYLFKKLISPQVFLGFSPEMDKHLSALQDKIATFNMPGFRTSASARQRIIAEHSRIIYHALKDPRMDKFRNDTIERHAQMLSTMMQPLRSSSAGDDEALESLRVVTSVTWDISTHIWISGMTLHYTFPECASKFSYGTMDALNGCQFAFTPEELQYSQYRVCFVIFPLLTLRDESKTGELRCHSLRKAGVLVMK